MTHVAKNIKAIRERRGLTQNAVARRCGFHDCYLSYYENGRRVPNLDHTMRIADALEVSVDAICRGIEQQYLPYGEVAVLATA